MWQAPRLTTDPKQTDIRRRIAEANHYLIQRACCRTEVWLLELALVGAQICISRTACVSVRALVSFACSPTHACICSVYYNTPRGVLLYHFNRGMCAMQLLAIPAAGSHGKWDCVVFISFACASARKGFVIDGF